MCPLCGRKTGRLTSFYFLNVLVYKSRPEPYKLNIRVNNLWINTYWNILIIQLFSRNNASLHLTRYEISRSNLLFLEEGSDMIKAISFNPLFIVLQWTFKSINACLIYEATCQLQHLGKVLATRERQHSHTKTFLSTKWKDLKSTTRTPHISLGKPCYVNRWVWYTQRKWKHSHKLYFIWKHIKSILR